MQHDAHSIKTCPITSSSADIWHMPSKCSRNKIILLGSSHTYVTHAIMLCVPTAIKRVYFPTCMPIIEYESTCMIISDGHALATHTHHMEHHDISVCAEGEEGEPIIRTCVAVSSHVRCRRCGARTDADGVRVTPVAAEHASSTISSVHSPHRGAIAPASTS